MATFQEEEEEDKTQESLDNETANDDKEQFSHNVRPLYSDIDQYIEALSTSSPPSQVPECVEALSKLLESRISMYNVGGDKFKNEEETFMEAVRQLYKLNKAFTQFSSPDTEASLNRTSLILQRAISFIEDKFCNLLEESEMCSKSSRRKKSSSFSDDICLISQPSDHSGDMKELKLLANTMIFIGYETECCQVYTVERRTVLRNELERLEFEKFNINDIKKMNWETTEGEISRWIRVVKHCSFVIFPRERKLVDSIFSEYPSISRSSFTNLTRTVIIQLIEFGEALGKKIRSAEKLFKFLDMYEAIRDLAQVVSSESNDLENELKSEIEAAIDIMGETAVNILSDLENSIKNDVAKSPVSGGAVHPLTLYIMDYLKYVSEYKDALEQIFERHTNYKNIPKNDESLAITSSLGQKLVAVMDLLDTNLEAKSKLYKDQSLSYIFLMNNGRCILQKVKASTEIHQLIGDTWYRKRSLVVRYYHKSYQRETWGKLLECINLDGVQQANGKVSKKLIKEKIKNFSHMFDEIHRTQSSWIVSDEQLLSELRVSISAIIIPAYRSFLGRYMNLLEGTRSKVEKYIKYQPEDIETLINFLKVPERDSMTIHLRRPYQKLVGFTDGLLA